MGGREGAGEKNCIFRIFGRLKKRFITNLAKVILKNLFCFRENSDFIHTNSHLNIQCIKSRETANGGRAMKCKLACILIAIRVVLGLESAQYSKIPTQHSQIFQFWTSLCMIYALRSIQIPHYPS